MALKLKFRTLFPALVQVESPLTLVKNGLAYVFGLDVNALIGSIGLDAFEPKADVMQIVTNSTGAILADTTLLVIQRDAPTLTELTLPALGTNRLRILDWSASITDHEIRLTPDGTNTIMKADTWSAWSNAAQLTSLTLHPNVTLNGWYIAP